MAINPDDPDFQKSSRLGSAYSNRAFVTVSNGMARVVFGESPSGVGEVVYHTAVSMTPSDLIALANVIYQVIDQVYPPSPGPTASETYDSYASPIGGALGQTQRTTKGG